MKIRGIGVALCATSALLLLAAMPASGNEPPIADAGPDQTVDLGDMVILDGTLSYDPDPFPPPLTYSWNIESAPAGSTAALLPQCCCAQHHSGPGRELADRRNKRSF